MNTLDLLEVAKIVRAAADMPFIMGGPEVVQHGGMTMLRVHFQPHTKVGFDTFHVWIADSTISVQVAAQHATGDHGFTHTSARAETDLTHMDEQSLANFIIGLKSKMD